MIRSCEYCRYWSPHGEGFGFCFRYAPRPCRDTSVDEPLAVMVWPVTSKNDWCGDGEEKGADDVAMADQNS